MAIVVFIRIATSCTVIIPCVRRCRKEALKEAGDLRRWRRSPALSAQVEESSSLIALSMARLM